jgi:uncharacterized integral membrane protein
MALRFVLFLIFASIVAIFTIQNSASVAIDFIKWQILVPQALVILLSALLGAATAYLMGGVQSIKLRSQLKEAAKKLAGVEEENNRLAQQIKSEIPEGTVTDGVAPASAVAPMDEVKDEPASPELGDNEAKVVDG